jgi:hypothetical protein
MRLYPPTAGMKAWRFLLQVALIQAVYGVGRLICLVAGHDAEWDTVYEMGTQRERHCGRCDKVEHWTVK